MKITAIEASGMGSHQDEIRQKVQEYLYDMEFTCIDEFHDMESRLIIRACLELNWFSIPQQGGFIVLDTEE